MLFSDVLCRVAVVAFVLIFKFQCAVVVYTPLIFFLPHHVHGVHTTEIMF